MATDLAIDYSTGDLLIAPDGDLVLRTGADTIKQEIRVRLRVVQGSWALDPSGGALGSRMRDIFRMPAFRAIGELELVIREALQPMEDIEVHNVDVTQDVLDKKILKVVIWYTVKDDQGVSEDLQTFETSVATE